MPERIVIKNLSLARGGRPILQNVSLAVQTGEFMALLGPNGSGKTTLLAAIAGILSGESGQILINGQPVRFYNSRRLARHIAYVAQTPVFPPGMTVLEYVMLGRYPWLAWHGFYSMEDRAVADNCILQTGLENFVKARLETLSGGESQRAALARALAQIEGQADAILLLDEPTSALDIAVSLDFMRLLKERSNLTILMAVHDFNLAALFASHIYGLKNGKCLFCGSTKTVFTKNNLERLYDYDFEVFFHPDNGSPQAIPRFSGNSYGNMPMDRNGGNPDI